MATALNLTGRIKQDPETLKKLAGLKAVFATKVQPVVDEALRKSEIVHFARVLVIDDKYLQVLTEYDGDPEAYTEFFRQALPQVFEIVFGLLEGAPPWSEMGHDRDAFFKFSKTLEVRALGDGVRGPDDKDGQPTERGYLFAAYGDKTVKELKPKA